MAKDGCRQTAPLSVSTALYLHQCGREACEGGHEFGPAVRDHYLIHCVFRGHGFFDDGCRRHDLHAGQGFLITPGVVTVYRADDSDPWNYGWVGFAGTDAEHVLRLCGAGREHPIFSFPSVEELESCVVQLVREYEHGGNTFAALSSLYRFFSLLQERPDGQIPAAGVLEQAMDYIQKNYSYPVRISSVAEYAGVSRSQLYRIFDEQLGLSPQEYLIGVRLDHAARMMAETSLSVTEILYSCGYSDPCHFSRQFRKQFGCPPTGYIREHRQKRPAETGR